MKRNRLFILGIVTVLVALLSLTLVSGTYAKYTSSATGSDTARVAKWEVVYNGVSPFAEGNDVDVSETNTIVFDLFNTIKDSNGTSDETDVKSAADTAAATTQIIAPGTSGSFQFKLKNKSEVTASANASFELTNTHNIPLEFNVNGGGWKSTLDSVALATLAMENGESTITVQWRWVFEVDGNTSGSGDPDYSVRDASDTTLGIAAQTGEQLVTVAATIVFTQVD